ncbi:MAG: Gfo/Idh/MocA family oxidoreductase [Novosphingobium sp.]
MNPVRVGILGCAKIIGWGLMDHREMLPEIEVVNIASRNIEKAAATARQYGFPRYGSYEDLLRDPEVEVVYVPLPNALHAQWSIAALRAGKAVVCEKPLASNAEEAEHLRAVAEETGLPLIEAVHYLYHPLAHRLIELVRSGALGRIERILAWVHLSSDFFEPDDIRFRYDLAGGATMDPGCYCISLCRIVTGEEPVVTSATPDLLSADIDRAMVATLQFPGGCVATVETSLRTDPWDIRLVVEGSRGRLETTNPLVPHFGHGWTLTVDGVETTESFDMTPTFVFEWKEIADVIRNGAPIRTPAGDGVANMKVVDAIYRAAGMRVR